MNSRFQLIDDQAHLDDLIITLDSIRQTPHDGKRFRVLHVLGIPQSKDLMKNIKPLDSTVGLELRIILKSITTVPIMPEDRHTEVRYL